ncbi:MAG: adenosine deaminase [Planctomycetota bacterium]|jgi:adenosine deaminase
MTEIIAPAVLARMPKVLLHNHLDGGLRPATIIELAEGLGDVELATSNPDELSKWFFRGANKGNLGEYLEGFGVTCGVMQDEESLARVATELLEDLHADGVVYTEVRFAPLLHTNKGLNYEQVMNAVIRGLEAGQEKTGVHWGIIVCALRNMEPALSLEMAELAVAFRNKGAVGFDLAGDENGHPPKAHLEAFQYCKRENFNITIHAGEAFGKASIWQALQYCGAHRIGHCTRLVEDMTILDGKVTHMGTLATYIRDHRIPLEICLQSNVHTGAVPNIESHPFRPYFDAHFRVTLNTDNGLMSDTTMSAEFAIANETFGLNARDLEKVTVNSMKSAFVDFDHRLTLIYDKIKAGYQSMRDEGLI